MTPRLTIADIKQLTLATSPYFFSRETLRFFGQTMRSFSVVRQADGRTRISAPMRYGRTVRFYNPVTHELETS